jgi:hypothetical protein
MPMKGYQMSKLNWAGVVRSDYLDWAAAEGLSPAADKSTAIYLLALRDAGTPTDELLDIAEIIASKPHTVAALRMCTQQNKEFLHETV